MRRTAFFVGVFTAIVVGITQPMHADSFLLGTSLELGNQGAYVGGEPSVGPVQHLLQPFSLTATVVVSSISLALAGPIPVGGSLPPKPFLVQLTNAIGAGATSANVLAQAQGTFPSGTSPEVVAVPLSVTLGPGNYFVVLSSSAGSGSWTQSSALPSSVGSVGSPAAHAFDGGADVAFPPASNWGYFSEPSTRFSFQLFGDATVPVSIDIKPGSDDNSINLSAAGVIPVAILGSTTFDAASVNPETVSLAGARVKLVGKSGRHLCTPEDVNQDGQIDLVCQVNTAQFMIEEGSSIAVLEATTYGGVPVRGQDTVRIVPD